MSPPVTSFYIRLLNSLLDVDRIQFRAILSELLQLAPPIEIADKECDRMANLVKKMQGLYKSSQEQAKAVDIHPVMDDVLLLIKKELQVKKIRLEKRYCPETHLIAAQEDKLKQVFLNILANAINAMPQGGLIQVSTQMISDHVHLLIHDSGEGIAQDKLSLIFEPFYTTKAAKGTGLGLYISYEIINSYGGEINVESKTGVGTTFTVILPVIKGARPG